MDLSDPQLIVVLVEKGYHERLGNGSIVVPQVRRINYLTSVYSS